MWGKRKLLIHDIVFCDAESNVLLFIFIVPLPPGLSGACVVVKVLFELNLPIIIKSQYLTTNQIEDVATEGHELC